MDTNTRFSKEFMQSWFDGKEFDGLEDEELIALRAKFNNDFDTFYQEWSTTELKDVTEREGILGLYYQVLTTQEERDKADEDVREFFEDESQE